jgi:hypothetical protein
MPDPQVHDRRTVEIAFVALRSIVALGVPPVLWLVVEQIFTISHSGPVYLAAATLYWLLVVGVLVWGVGTLRSFERRLHEQTTTPGDDRSHP